MIPLQDLIGWRAHAPWPNDEQVEQDYLLSKSVAAIVAKTKFRQDVKSMLSSSFGEYDIDLACEEVCDVFLTKLR